MRRGEMERDGRMGYDIGTLIVEENEEFTKFRSTVSPDHECVICVVREVCDC